MALEIWSYEDVLKDLATNNPGIKRNLLLGNGFSRVFADQVFSYTSLFDKAKGNFNANILSVFAKAGETNFERALRTYDDALWLMDKYGEKIESSVQKDRDQIRTTLIDIISQNHPEDQSILSKDSKEKTFSFLAQFKNIFTTNYDFILYWMSLYKLDEEGSWDDGFRKKGGVLKFNEFEGEFCIYYLHGALHLVRREDVLSKLSWKDNGDKLKNLITASITEGVYPVFVAEGDSEKKKAQIKSDYYLRECWEALGRMTGVLVVFGHSMNPNYDKHIIDQIISSSSLDKIFIGVHGKNVERDNAELLKYLDPLPITKKIQFYQSETVPLV